MTRDKLENIVRDELYSHCDPLELTIDDKRLVSAILAALEAERVGDGYMFIPIVLPDMKAEGVIELSDGTKTDWENIELYAKVRRHR